MILTFYEDFVYIIAMLSNKVKQKCKKTWIVDERAAARYNFGYRVLRISDPLDRNDWRPGRY